MKSYNTNLHIQQTRLDPIYGPVFDGYMTGDALNVFGSLVYSPAMGDAQATAYREAVEKRAFEFNQTETISSETLEPVEAFINLTVFRSYIVNYDNIGTEILKKRYEILRSKLVLFETPESVELHEIERQFIKRGEYEVLNYGKQPDDWR